MTDDGGVRSLSGVDERVATELRTAGYETVEDLRDADRDDLAALDGVSTPFAARIKADVGDAAVDADDEADGGTDDEADDDAGPDGDHDAGSAVDGDPETTRCSDCGAEITRRAFACPECGVRQEESPERARGDVMRKRPAIAGFLSLLLIGTGQLYNHQILRAFVVAVVGLFVGALLFQVSPLLTFLVPVGAGVDAFLQAKFINARYESP